MTASAAKTPSVLSLTVLVAGLGYFVDIYDLVLFGIVRVDSLKSIGVSDDQMMNVGAMLQNLQMAGMLLGGILWGMLGDRRGRLSVLFGSILLYSLATFANAFVTTLPQYAVLRFIAGIGLAGELGGAVTLVSELLCPRTRGYGTTLVAGLGLLGAIAAATISQYTNWQSTYIIGGTLGLLLLALRVNMLESGMFQRLREQSTADRQATPQLGKFRLLLAPPARFKTYLCCILIGVPLYFTIVSFLLFAPEVTKTLNAKIPLTAATAYTLTYIGITMGDVASGLLSQYLKRRRRVMRIFLILSGALSAFYLLAPPTLLGDYQYHILSLALGFAGGYWAVLMMNAAEQFGTNIRATATTTVPNFVRAATIPITLSITALKPDWGLIPALLITGTLVYALALIALAALKDTYGKDLDYLEAAPA